mgnify:FL=1
MEQHHLEGCANIIDGSSFFSQWGLRGESIARGLLVEIERRDADLRVLLDEREQVMGFAWLMPRGAFGRSAYLRLIAIAEDERQKGGGRKLMETLEDDSLEPHGLALLVTSENTGARQFYERLGYEQVGLLPDYIKDGIDECLYIKQAR